MTRRTWTLVTSVALAVVLGVSGGVATVPFVALGPGPTYNTLGEVNGETVVVIEGAPTYPTTGHLNMTTVEAFDGVTLFGALGFWFSGRYALVPRDEVYPPELTDAEAEERSVQLFETSSSAAETAALRYLGYPPEVVVEAVDSGAPADGRLAPGDELVTVDGAPVSTPQEVLDALADRAPGDVVGVGFSAADGSVRTVRLPLQPGAETGRGYLGIQIAEQPDADVEITINLAEVVGPSAGLMFALAIVDKLEPGALADGTFVAGTGAITPSGEVRPIGGIPFKMRRAADVGATVFLVPAGNCAEAVRRAPDGLRLVRVDTLGGAVDALEALAARRPTPSC